MIEIQGLSKYYDGLCAVDDFHLQVPGGQILGLLGPNGAGKTTILRILTGYLQPTLGSIRIKGRDPEREMLAAKADMGYLPESIPIYRNMLVHDFLEYMIRVRGISLRDPQERIRELASTFAIGDVMHKPVAELSKGYLQRVGLAHALLHDPEILILDEPTSGLDPNQILEIRSLIRQVGQHKTVILSTHILSEAEATCDRMVILHRGRTVADGNPQELKSWAGSGSSVYLELKNASFQEVSSRLEEFSGIDRVTSLGESDREGLGLRLELSPGKDPREEIYNSIKQTDWVLLHMSLETGSLEDTFKELTLES